MGGDELLEHGPKMRRTATSTKAKPITATIWTAMKRFMTNLRPSLRS